MNPRVAAVVPKSDYTLELEFTNGELGVYDCAPLLDFGGFQDVRDMKYFQQAQAVGGTVVWPHEQDICPDTLYEDSIKRSTESSPELTNRAAIPGKTPHA